MPTQDSVPLIDIVIPTMWRPSGVARAIATYASCKGIASVVVIDNDPAKRQIIPPEAMLKTRIISHGKNIYVNPAWNEGVSLCRSKIVCLANDDVLIDPALFSFIQSLEWERLCIDLIGLGTSAVSSTTELTRISVNLSQPLGVQYPGFGACMFLRREAYQQIPASLSVWFGDDYLVHMNKGIFLLATPYVKGEMSATIKSFDISSEVHQLIRADTKWAHENLLERRLS